MKNENVTNSQWEMHFMNNRTFLLAFSFRMVGSLSEAEDIVQDTFIRCYQTDPESIINHKAWLTKVCSNLALDHLKSAYKRRETYPGVWLPDAIPDRLQIWNNLSNGEDHDKDLILRETLTTTFLLIAEKLKPEERVIYLLSEVFEFSFIEISKLLDKSEEACRKTAQRARLSINENKPKTFATEESPKVLAAFFECVKKGDKKALAEMLTEESEFWADGGGKATAVIVVMRDKFKIAQFFNWLGTTDRFSSDKFKAEETIINALPGFAISRQLPSGLWEFETLLSFEFAGDKISRIYSQRNPDKLNTLIKFNPGI